jgi:two-component system OmpR family response regulator
MPALSRIMYVDDDPDLRAIAEISLRDLGGFTVELCGSGEEALQKAENFKPQIILLDVMMPGMDGYQTTAAIRAMPEFASLPIIAVTAKAMAGDRERAIASGASGYITKPVDVDRLLSLMAVWLYPASDGAAGVAETPAA